MYLDLPDDQNECTDLGIAGLCFAPNDVEVLSDGARTHILSNSGYTVGHFVTHGPAFTYGEQIGYHVGQVDQLTFLSLPPRQLVAEFIDCRAGSPTLRRRVRLRFLTSPARRLIIPAGVAHTFDGIGGVVTRNDLLLYTSHDSSTWRVEDDLVSIPKSAPLGDVVPVTVNTLLLPRQVALLFYRLQSALMLGGPRGAYSEAATEQSSAQTAEDTTKVRWRPNSYFAVAPGSWGLLPSTPSCVTRLEILHLRVNRSDWSVYPGQDALYTFLDRADDTLVLNTLNPGEDLRQTTPRMLPLLRDERWHLFVPAGIVHRFEGHQDLLVRVELDPAETDAREEPR